jgi:hypothetical protein
MKFLRTTAGDGADKKGQAVNSEVEAKPLDEAVWQAWGLKGVAEDKRSNAAWIKRLKWFALAALLVAMGLWSVGLLDVRTAQ